MFFCIGIGKTTVCIEICVRWARDGLLFDDFDTVLQIPMSTCRRHSLQEAAIAQIGEDAYSKIMDSSGARCLVILDGMVTADLQNDNILSQLVKGSFLSKTVLLITARPQACNNLVCDRTIEITGLDKNQVSKYFQNFFPTVSQSQLSCSPLAKVVSRVPLFLIMMLSVFQCSPAAAFPSTITDLHHLFVTMCLQKTSVKMNLLQPQAVFKCKEKLLAILPDINSEDGIRLLLQLSKLAYDVFFNQNNVTEDVEVCFTEENLRKYFPKNVNLQEFSLIKSKTLFQGTQGTIYCFTSSTVLLFLCSLHIAMDLSEQEQLVLMQEYFDKLPNVMIMLCGLTRLNTPELFHFVCRKLVGSVESKLTATKCLYESQRSNSPNGISYFNLSICFLSLSPYDILCISYIVNQYPVLTLTLRECHLGNSDLKILAQWCEKQGTCLEKLDISVNEFDTNAVKDILKIMKSKLPLKCTMPLW